MRILLQTNAGEKQELTVPDDAVVNKAIIQRGETYYLFEGYLGGFAHTALFTECAPPLILVAQEQNPKPARKFMGQKPKDV